MGELLALAAEAAGGQHHHLVAVQPPVSLETMTLITQVLHGAGPLPAAAGLGQRVIASHPCTAESSPAWSTKSSPTSSGRASPPHKRASSPSRHAQECQGFSRRPPVRHAGRRRSASSPNLSWPPPSCGRSLMYSPLLPRPPNSACAPTTPPLRRPGRSARLRRPRRTSARASVRHNAVAYRAQLSFRVDRRVLSDDPILQHDPLLPDSWWADLAEVLEKVVGGRHRPRRRTTAVHGPGDPRVRRHPGPGPRLAGPPHTANLHGANLTASQAIAPADPGLGGLGPPPGVRRRHALRLHSAPAERRRPASGTLSPSWAARPASPPKRPCAPSCSRLWPGETTSSSKPPPGLD